MIKKIILLTLFFAGILNAANLNLNKNTYNPNEKITVNFTGMTAKNKDWIAIYPENSNNEWANVKRWNWTGDKTAGDLVFKGLPAGRYEVRAFYNNSFHSEVRKQFTVGGNNEAATVRTSKEIYNQGETVTATFNHMSGNNKDWIGIYPAESTDAWGNVVQWKWTGGQVQGTNTFVNLPAGNYEVRVFFKNSFKLEAHHAFKITAAANTTVNTNKAKYNLGEAVVVNYRNMENHEKDWVGIYLAGSTNAWANVVDWKWSDGQVNGQKTFNNLPKGNYEVRVFFRNSFKVEATHPFRVGQQRDVYIIQGQSNAQAVRGENLALNEKVKSFGYAATNANYTKKTLNWYTAQANSKPKFNPFGFIGKWGMYMSSNIANSLDMPLVVLNGAVGGTRISQHLKDNANPENLNTIYGRLLYRAKKANIANEARVLFWYQGENDGSVHTSIATYKNRFRTLYNSWKNDYKNLEKIYIFQVRAGCGNPVFIMEAQRQIANEYDDVEMMSTTGTNTQVLADNCHYTLNGYKELANRMERLVKDDLYHIAQIEAHPPEIETIHFVNNKKSVVLKLKEAQNLHMVGNSKKDFIIENSNIKVTSINILNQTEIRLNFSKPLANNAKLTYFGHKGSENSWIQNSNKLGLITFYSRAITN